MRMSTSSLDNRISPTTINLVIATMTPKKYAEIRAQQRAIIETARALIREAYDAAVLCPIPETLRPATPDDVKEGAIIWMPEWEGKKWSLVEGVEYPDDPFHGWTENGAFYGIHKGFVEENRCDVHPPA